MSEPSRLAAVAARVRERLSGTLDQHDLAWLRADADGAWYECPCGGADHSAWRPAVREGNTSVGLASVLTCFVTGHQWFVRVDVAGTIRAEEEAYLRLLERAGPLVRKLRRRHPDREPFLAYLKDTHGIDRDVAEPFLEVA